MESVTQNDGATSAETNALTFPLTLKRLRASDLFHPLIAFLITRIVVYFGGYIGEIALPSATNDAYYHVAPNNVFIDIWSRWDSAFYIEIVEKGYFFVPEQISNVAFFPLYPLLTSIVSLLTPSVYVAGIIVSHLALLGALYFLYKLAALEFDAATARRTVYYIAAFPTAFFFSAVYTESTYLFVSVAAVYFARRRLWAWATLFVMLTTVSRIVGLGVWGIVGLEWMAAQGWTLATVHRQAAWQNLLRGLRARWTELALICTAPLGLISHMIFLNRTVQDPLAFWSVQSAWGREDIGFVRVILRDTIPLYSQNFGGGDIWWHVIFDVGSLLLVLALSVPIWRKLGEGMAIYSVIAMLIPASSGAGSLMRYVVVVFPVFMILAVWGRRETVDRAIMFGFTLFLGIFTTLFVNWIFVA